MSPGCGRGLRGEVDIYIRKWHLIRLSENFIMGFRSRERLRNGIRPLLWSLACRHVVEKIMVKDSFLQNTNDLGRFGAKFLDGGRASIRVGGKCIRVARYRFFGLGHVLL